MITTQDAFDIDTSTDTGRVSNKPSKLQYNTLILYQLNLIGGLNWPPERPLEL